MRYIGVGVEGWAVSARRRVLDFHEFEAPGEEFFFSTSSHESRAVGAVLGTLTLRYPFHCSRFSPYIFGGGGAIFVGGQRDTFTDTEEGSPQGDVTTNFHSGSTTEAIGQVGGGLEVRFTPHIGWVSDFSWNFVDGPKNNFGMVRTGVNFAFYRPTIRFAKAASGIGRRFCLYAICVCERGHGHEIIVMPFVETLDNLALKKSELVKRFEHLIAPKSDREFEAMAQTSRALTLQNFGRTMRLFAPLYLSNECINNCRYCGFSRDNPILRVTLNVDEVIAEAQHLARQGFRQILLVAGEHPKFAGRDYLAECVRALAPDFSSISIEVGPMETEDYVPIVEAGAEGLVVYQETYNRGIYAEMHTAGPKRDFNFRLECAERAYTAGFRRLGIGALIGLSRWQDEAIA